MGEKTKRGKSFVHGKTKRTRKERPVPLRDLPQSEKDVLRAQKERGRGERINQICQRVEGRRG